MICELILFIGKRNDGNGKERNVSQYTIAVFSFDVAALSMFLLVEIRDDLIESFYDAQANRINEIRLSDEDEIVSRDVSRKICRMSEPQHCFTNDVAGLFHHGVRFCVSVRIVVRLQIVQIEIA